MPGDDNDEYFELSGDAGESLEGLSYIVVGDHSGENPTKGSGTIEFALNLQGSIPQSGLFLGVEFSFTLAPELVTEEFFDLFFENSDNVTHLLVRDYTGPEVFSVADQEGEAGVDIDTDDDGVPDLDPLPWSSVVDVLGVVEEREGGERFYGEMLGGVDIGPSGPFAPAHVFETGPTTIGSSAPSQLTTRTPRTHRERRTRPQNLSSRSNPWTRPSPTDNPDSSW